MGISDIFAALGEIAKDLFKLHEEGKLTKEHLQAAVDGAAAGLHTVPPPKKEG
jgi:hypothetical protein